MQNDIVEAVAWAMARYEGFSDPTPYRSRARAILPIAAEHFAGICEQTRDGFLSEQYATGQPTSSFNERFACGQCAAAIRASVEPTK